LRANPWMGGRLKSNKEKRSSDGKPGVALVWEATPVTPHEEILEQLLQPTLRKGKVVKALPEIHCYMKWHLLAKRLRKSACLVPTGAECVDKNYPLFALTIVKDLHRTSDDYCLVFSACHAIVDATTYYKLLNMLNANEPIISLNPTRNLAFPQISATATGAAESSYLLSKGHLWNKIRTSLFGHKIVMTNYFLHTDKIAAAKEEAKAKGATDGTKVPYITTNDILVSGFAAAINARVIIAPINFRKVNGTTLLDVYKKNDDSANYEMNLVLTEESFATPSNVRKMMNSGPPNFKRGGVDDPPPLPDFWESAKSKNGI
jgi:hypothetical protein